MSKMLMLELGYKPGCAAIPLIIKLKLHHQCPYSSDGERSASSIRRACTQSTKHQRRQAEMSSSSCMVRPTDSVV